MAAPPPQQLQLALEDRGGLQGNMGRLHTFAGSSQALGLPAGMRKVWGNSPLNAIDTFSLSRNDPILGFACLNEGRQVCLDYQVRFICPAFFCPGKHLLAFLELCDFGLPRCLSGPCDPYASLDLLVKTNWIRCVCREILGPLPFPVTILAREDESIEGFSLPMGYAPTRTLELMDFLCYLDSRSSFNSGIQWLPKRGPDSPW